ncbi:SH3 domain-containing YSC84-like protein 1 isoform X2 [Engraulis encrasicolus]|uniref:SH3 domain-containing YSC84-like protein 1 isoform X2 n=1 Tax=Engraulis encrasicolus TaxID=184585 RepID=UPI002FD74DCA
MNNPIPSNLKSESKKAAKILREFTEISNRTGPDKLIPAHIIATAQGLAIISVIRAGFMITARGGSGIVIAKLPDGRWSAPSAIGIAGLGGGFEIGLEASDFVIILYQRRAVEAFSKGGNLTFGGNCTVAVGPLGRNLEADVALRSTSPVFSYCKSRGLYAGVSLEGSYLLERKETNRKFYGRDIRASAILNGDVDPPFEVQELYTILDDYVEKYTNDWQRRHSKTPSNRPFGLSMPGPPRPRPPSQKPSSSSGGSHSDSKPALYPSLSVVKRDSAPASSGSAWTSSSTSASSAWTPSPSSSTSADSAWGSASGGSASAWGAPSASAGSASAWGASASSSSSSPAPLMVTAVHAFEGQQSGDLSFNAGDQISVITKTDSQYDWWEGRLGGKVGIFPANYVTYN